jgi:glucose-1-phosphate thymidylyltransferase
VVVSDRKPEILRYLADGSSLDIKIAYVVQSEALGLAHAVDSACRWASITDSNCCLALPDTICEPEDAIARVKEELVTSDADLVLGVFPTDAPTQLGPVRTDDDGYVTQVLDKPKETDLANTWALAAWSPRFSQLLHEEVERGADTDVILGEIFDRASRSGLRVRAVEFSDGTFYDAGTRAGLAAVLSHALAKRPR